MRFRTALILLDFMPIFSASATRCAASRASPTMCPPARNNADRSGLAMTPPALLIVSPEEMVCRAHAVYRYLRPGARFAPEWGCAGASLFWLQYLLRSVATQSRVWRR